MNKVADKRAHLDLQVNVLAEHAVSRSLTLVSATARKLQVADADNPEFDELALEVSTGMMLDTINKHKQDSINESGIKY